MKVHLGDCFACSNAGEGVGFFCYPVPIVVNIVASIFARHLVALVYSAIYLVVAFSHFITSTIHLSLHLLLTILSPLTLLGLLPNTNSIIIILNLLNLTSYP